MLPPGYQVHPSDSLYMWNPTTNDVRPIPAEPAPVAAAPPQEDYGTLDLGVAEEEYKAGGTRSAFQRDKDLIWLDFPKDIPQGSEATIIVRFLPPWPGSSRAWLHTATHRVFAEFIPNSDANRRVYYIDCFDLKGGPGGCPICAALDRLKKSGIAGADGIVANARTRTKVAWQLLNLSSPQDHFAQEVGLDGGPVINPATGQPTYKVLPGILRITNDLHLDILNFIRKKGNPTNPDSGYNFHLTKRKTGPRDLDVTYNAMDAHPSPLDPNLRDVLRRLVNMPERCTSYRSREDMVQIGDAMLAKAGVGAAPARVAPAPTVALVPAPALSPALPPAQWLPHPQSAAHEYNPQTGAVRQRAAPPPPVVAPPPPPPMPVPVAAAPVPPVAAYVGPGAPPPPLPAGYALPPATAPGMVPGAVPMAPPPPPPPGMPPAIGSPPPAPPAMTPEQLEAALDTDIPF